MPNGSVMYVRDNVNNKNKILEVDGSNQLSVKDATAQSTLSTINSNMATAANQSTANSALASIDTKVSTAANQATANSSLASIDTKVATAANQATGNASLASIVSNSANISSDQATATLQGTANSKLDTINTTLSGTLSVSSGAPSRTNGNLANSASKSAGDVSSSVNGTNYKTAVVFGSCSSMTGSVRIQVSHDNSNFYEDHNSRFYANSTNGHFVGRFTLDAPYFKVEFMDTATYTMEYSLCS